MKILLINTNRHHQPWPVIPFGLCCVASALEAAGHRVRFLDLCFSKKCAEEIIQAVREFQPGLTGLSIRNIDNAGIFKNHFFLEDIRRDIVLPLKAAFSGPMVVGGPAVGINPREILEYLDLDLAIGGDGEVATVELARRLEQGLPLDGLGGLTRREQGQIVASTPPQPVQNLDLLPLVDLARYVDTARYHRFDSPLQIQTKRGCPLSCVYCTYNRIEGQAYRLRDPEMVADQIEAMVRSTGINHVEFTDSTFNLPLPHAKKVLRALLARKLKLRLRTLGLNPAGVDEELVDLMVKAGFQEVDLGAEAACAATLTGLGKGFGVDAVIRAGQLLRSRGLPTSWMLLLGGPGETLESATETLETVAKIASPWDLIVVGAGIRIYQGSPLAKDLMEAHPECSGDNFLHAVAYSPPSLSLDELRALVRRAWQKYPNLLIYSEDLSYAPVLVRGANLLRRLFMPKAPLWTFFILYRRAARILSRF